MSCGSILRISLSMPSGPGDLSLLSDLMHSLNQWHLHIRYQQCQHEVYFAGTDAGLWVADESGYNFKDTSLNMLFVLFW
eukprot:676601-Pelagomonas_calceolata.AAC.1